MSGTLQGAIVHTILEIIMFCARDKHSDYVLPLTWKSRFWVILSGSKDTFEKSSNAHTANYIQLQTIGHTKL